MVEISRLSLFFLTALSLTACDKAGLNASRELISNSINNTSPGEKLNVAQSIPSLEDLVENSNPKVDVDAGFLKATTQALELDAEVLTAKSILEASKATLRTTSAGSETKINATVLGGAEDISDERIGIAAILTADRVLYDGGILEARVATDTLIVKSAEQAYFATLDERALVYVNAWIELDQYTELSKLIESRLSVLEPLLAQFESVASAGVGDVGQVTAARRTASAILVAKARVSAKYQLARTAFINRFGRLPINVRYNAPQLPKKLYTKSPEKLAQKSPMLLSKYLEYRAAEAAVVAITAQDNVEIAFRAKLQRPFGGSNSNSDESIGFVLTKNFYQGNQLLAQIDRAEATAEAKSAGVSANFKDAKLKIRSARAVIKSLGESIDLARRVAQICREEIDYLRKQLIIGGSSLEKVLSAEVRLYEAESQEITFVAERRKAEASIMAVTGHYSHTFGANSK